MHLVIDSVIDPESISKFMKRVAGRQTRYANTLEGRSGSLWEGRFKNPASSLQQNSYQRVAVILN